MIDCLIHQGLFLVYVLQVKSSKTEEKRKDSEKKRKKHAVIESGNYIIHLHNDAVTVTFWLAVVCASFVIITF